MTPTVAIEMLFGNNDVDSVAIRLAGDPARLIVNAELQEEAKRIVGLALVRLANVAPHGWGQFAADLTYAGQYLMGVTQDV